jgi:hypothetical protein
MTVREFDDYQASINNARSMITDLENQNLALRLEIAKKDEEIAYQLREVGRLMEFHELG